MVSFNTTFRQYGVVFYNESDEQICIVKGNDVNKPITIYDYAGKQIMKIEFTVEDGSAQMVKAKYYEYALTADDSRDEETMIKESFRYGTDLFDCTDDNLKGLDNVNKMPLWHLLIEAQPVERTNVYIAGYEGMEQLDPAKYQYGITIYGADMKELLTVGKNDINISNIDNKQIVSIDVSNVELENLIQAKYFKSVSAAGKDPQFTYETDWFNPHDDTIQDLEHVERMPV